MSVTAHTHIVKKAELDFMKALGWQFQGGVPAEHEFINQYFTHLNLLRFSVELEQQLEHCYAGDITRIVSLSNIHPPVLQILYLSDNYADERNGLALSRIFTFDNGELVVHHDFFRIPESARGKGVAKSVFAILLQQYVNMGVKKIKVFAALTDGGYVWARNFFTADRRDEMDVIINDASKVLDPKQLNAIVRIYDNYYSKSATKDAFPIHKWAVLPFMKDVLRGSQWHGTIDLTNSEQFSNFIKYVLG